MSHFNENARRDPAPSEDGSATTAEGLAAERTELADRDRERATSRARVAARRLEDAHRLEDAPGEPAQRRG
jgi:hypothetical protein